MTSLYDTLGILPDADMPTIKRAYRKRAKKSHPDTGGTTDEFQKLAKAYLVLVDPKRRAQYDRDGTFDDSPQNDPLNAAMSLIVQFFCGVMAQAADKLDSPVFTQDLVSIAREEFRKQSTQIKRDRINVENRQKVWQKFLARLKHKNDDDLIRRGLRQQAAQFSQAIVEIDRQLALRTDALRLLEGYSFERDPAAQSTSPFANIEAIRFIFSS